MFYKRACLSSCSSTIRFSSSRTGVFGLGGFIQNETGPVLGLAALIVLQKRTVPVFSRFYRKATATVADNDHPPPPPAPGQPSLPLCGLPGFMNNGLDFHGATMAQLCSALSRFADRQVIDKTGIAGKFDIRLNAPIQPPPQGDPPPDPGEVTRN